MHLHTCMMHGYIRKILFQNETRLQMSSAYMYIR